MPLITASPPCGSPAHSASPPAWASMMPVATAMPGGRPSSVALRALSGPAAEPSGSTRAGILPSRSVSPMALSSVSLKRSSCAR